ncbi:MAG: HNH endonuclease [Gaiellaceae bacterium]
MRGFIGHTDAGWWRHLTTSPELSEVNFWRPGGRTFAALNPGEPFFFRLKSPVNKIGGFGLFARYAALPVWRAWEVFGLANGVRDEPELVERLERLARRRVSRTSVIGCIAVTDCTFFQADSLIDVPGTFNPQNLSGSVVDLEQPEGRRLWAACLDRAVAVTPANAPAADWLQDAASRQRFGRAQIVTPRLGQGSFRLAVLDVYGRCAVTGEHSLPALEAAHIRPFGQGGTHDLRNGLPFRRDLHRLFDLGYVSVKPTGEFIVSPRLNTEFANGHTYYALAGQKLREPKTLDAAPDPELLAWHSETIFQPA